ncbi:MAG: acyl carrier protein [Sneathiella sp.]|jgi:acyl carrier protein|uniref:acyl carrier protein n=1 Tax=Sneathiella sp. TaxID=1964365 RepID=UPI000C3F38F2|nr:acyl carrier protein [Sneathiella sp.]MAL77997.1 acyl carrier protein [Sneathiella sp.]|tara:strand:+ start:198 stop:443 length:246 start_codon:yes stop_codon:yes gene_type:complete
MTREDIYNKLSEYLVEMFEVPPEQISPDAQLYEDLDLDSIDAVDLVVKLQDLTGKKIPPEEFRTVRSVGDVVDRVHALLAA